MPMENFPYLTVPDVIQHPTSIMHLKKIIHFHRESRFKIFKILTYINLRDAYRILISYSGILLKLVAMDLTLYLYISSSKGENKRRKTDITVTLCFLNASQSISVA